MTDELDEALKSTLKAAARNAPAVQSDLLDRVAARHRVRRRNRVVAAAMAMIVVIGGTGVTGAVLRSRDEAPPPATEKTATPTPTRTDRPGEPVSVRDRWPRALLNLPDRLPNGREYRPVTLVDDRSLLLTTQAGNDGNDRIWIYDLRSRNVRLLTGVPGATDGTRGVADFAVGDGRIAFAVQPRVQTGERPELWTIPVAGGRPRKVADMGLEMRGPLQLAIEDGKVYWSRSSHGEGGGDAVYEAPLSGGTPREVPGSRGYQIVSWPWIGTPGGSREKVGSVNYGTVRNVRTGEVRTFRPPKLQRIWECGVTWCVSGPVGSVVYHGERSDYVMRRDGTQVRELPARNLMGTVVTLGGPLYGRFLPYSGEESQQWMLYDLQTGDVLDMGVRNLWGYSIQAAGSAERLAAIVMRGKTVAARGKIIAVDLAAID